MFFAHISTQPLIRSIQRARAAQSVRNLPTLHFALNVVGGRHDARLLETNQKSHTLKRSWLLCSCGACTRLDPSNPTVRVWLVTPPHQSTNLRTSLVKSQLGSQTSEACYRPCALLSNSCENRLENPSVCPERVFVPTHTTSRDRLKIGHMRRQQAVLEYS